MANLNEQFPGNLVPGEIPGDPGAGSFDTAQVIDELLPHLHAASRSDADLTFWTEEQLVEWMDESLKRLARKAAVFVDLQTSTATGGDGLYPLPPQHVSTIHVTFNGQVLRPASVQDLELRDAGFEWIPGFPDHWYENLLGLASIGLTPVPDGEGVLLQVYERWPPTVDLGQTMLAAPPPIKGYLAHAVLAECYGREGECETPDLAEHCRARVAMYEKAFVAYYGPGK